MTNTSCGYHEVHAKILMNLTEENVSPSRLASIPLQELKTQSTVGIITKDTQQKFQLGKVSFLSTVNKRNNSHDEYELHLKLKIMIPESVTSHPLFDEIELVVRCLNGSDASSLGTRHEAGHYRLVYYNETSMFQYCRALGSFRLDYMYEIEYENDFSILEFSGFALYCHNTYPFHSMSYSLDLKPT